MLIKKNMIVYRGMLIQYSQNTTFNDFHDEHLQICIMFKTAWKKSTLLFQYIVALAEWQNMFMWRKAKNQLQK